MSRYQDPDGAGEQDGPADYGPARGAGHPRLGGQPGHGGRSGYAAGAAGRHGTMTGGRPRGNGGHRARAQRGKRGRNEGRPGASGGRLAVLGSRPVLSLVAIIATVAVTGIALTAYAAYRNVYDSIHHVDVTNSMLGKRPPKLNGATNILVIGSDSRAGLHGYGRGIAGSRSDTSMLLHISPTHSHVFVISFPRDSMVPIYGCQGDGQGHPGQQAQPGALERLNATFSDGGAPCLWKTLEQTTHIHIDHFIEVDFTGFQKIVNDVGGVKVCLPFAIHDPASKLNLSRGVHVVNGAQALAFVRERHIGLGSDLQRIQRQQYFLASVAQKIKSSGILGDPPKLYTLVHDVASSLTTDSALSPTELYAIANSLKNLSPSSLRFISVPVVPYPGDPGAEVQWAQPAADRLFRAIARDSKILKAAKAAKVASPKATPAPTVSPAQVRLQVLNGTNTAGLAASTASKLTAKGFTVTGTGNAPTATYTATVIEYGAASLLPQVNTLKHEIPGAQAKLVTGLPAGSLALILGSSFKGLASAGHRAGRPSAAAVANSYGGISGNANICKDSGAFAGPDTPSMFGG